MRYYFYDERPTLRLHQRANELAHLWWRGVTARLMPTAYVEALEELAKRHDTPDYRAGSA